MVDLLGLMSKYKIQVGAKGDRHFQEHRDRPASTGRSALNQLPVFLRLTPFVQGYLPKGGSETPLIFQISPASETT